jgi:hypothetical protein
MKTYEIKIQGITSAIQNKLSRELIQEQKKIPNDKREDWEENNWKKKLYTNKQGQPYWPYLNIRSLLISTCTKYKVPPPKSVGKTWGNYFRSSVLPEDATLEYTDIVPLGIMVNGNPSAKGKSSKVYKIRPQINNWKTTITIMDTEGYGRFKVLSVKETEIGGD